MTTDIPPRWLSTLSDVMAAESWPPRSGAPYDWRLPTQEVYFEDGDDFTDRFKNARGKLDYNYHRHPATKRQLLQDAILSRVVQHQSEIGKKELLDEAKSTRRPWLVFSAGPMGVGKSYVLSKLHSTGFFPLDQFLKIDPDMIKSEIPEFAGYLRENPETAATMLHAESTQMADILFQYALSASLDMLVDGSLRDVEWYTYLISNQLRTNYPNYRIAILHVTAHPDTIRERARERATISGRAVPTELLEESIEQVPKSVQRLAPLVDATYTISNNEGEPMRLIAMDHGAGGAMDHGDGGSPARPHSMLWSDFANAWQNDDAAGNPDTRKEHECEHLLTCNMIDAWTDTATQASAKAIWGGAYPNFCPRCTLACDTNCGVCIHGRHVCACEICG